MILTRAGTWQDGRVTVNGMVAAMGTRVLPVRWGDGERRRVKGEMMWGRGGGVLSLERKKGCCFGRVREMEDVEGKDKRDEICRVRGMKHV